METVSRRILEKNRSLRLIPNFVTAFRVLCSPVVAWLLFQSSFRIALLLALLAGISDWLDGFTARKLKLSGKLGIVFDPLADKALLITLFITLGVLQLVPAWMFWLVVGRDLVIVFGALLVRILRGLTKFPPLMVGKVSTFFQIVLIVSVLCLAAFPLTIFLWLKNMALGLTALFTLWSGISYVRLGIAIARRQMPSLGTGFEGNSQLRKTHVDGGEARE